MPSLIARVIKLGARHSIRYSPKSPTDLVRHLRRHMNNPPPYVPVRGITIGTFSEQGLQGDIVGVAHPAQAILYLHGGGYVCGKTRTYHNLASRLAQELAAEVWLPDYRLAPEHAFPAAIEDAVAMYELLLVRGWRPEQITLAGDSAGGGLTLGTLLALRDANRPMPRCAVVLSPVTDVRFVNPSIRGNDASDWMLGADMLETGRPLYAQTPEDALHPYASPALASLAGLPPLFVTVCEQECLRDDAYMLVEAARRDGVDVILFARPDVLHVWPIFVPFMREAREDLQRIANFIRGHGRPPATRT